jgi:hypothetical protein
MMKVAFAAAFSLLLLAACGRQEQTSAQNDAAGGEMSAPANSGTSDPRLPVAPAGDAGNVPPPDAVSHPDGYLPPVPGEAAPAGENSSGSDPSPPATEDEYIRNRQGRP